VKLTKEQLLQVLLGEHSEPVAAWTHEGDLIVGVYPQADTYELLLEGGPV